MHETAAISAPASMAEMGIFRRNRNGSMGFVHQAEHVPFMGRFGDGLEIGTNTVIGGIVDKMALASGWRSMVARTSLRDIIPGQCPNFALGVDIHRNGAAEHHGVDDALVYISGQDDLVPFFHIEKTMACTAEVVPPTIKKAWAASEKPLLPALRPPLSRNRMGWHRLSRGFMEFTSTGRHCSPRKRVSSGLPPAPLVAGHIKGAPAGFLNPLQGFLAKERGPDPSAFHLLKMLAPLKISIISRRRALFMISSRTWADLIHIGIEEVILQIRCP